MITRLNTVLVGTQYSSNVGMCARAVANMSGDKLILVNPQCEINSHARQGAAGAQEHLQKILTYKDWNTFYHQHGQGVRIALTRRPGKSRKLIPLKELLCDLQQRLTQMPPQPMFLFFGPEDNGLSNEDLEWVHHCAQLPTFGSFHSLNLSQAVLLALYIVQENLGSLVSHIEDTLNSEKFYFPETTIREWLDAMGFPSEDRQSSAYLTLRRLFMHNYPTAQELHVIESVLQQSIRKMSAPDSVFLER